MSEWGPWQKYRYTKHKNGAAYEYERIQRSRRVPGRDTPETQTIHVSVGRRRRLRDVAIALVGVRDDYDRPHNSLLNKVLEKGEAAQRVSGQNKGTVGKGGPAKEAVSQSDAPASHAEEGLAGMETPSQ